MIQAEEFVETAKKFGFDWYSGVPCSFLTPFINYVINHDNLTYLSSANEGDALAAAAGATIAGKRAVVMMQNSGLGNAINPLTSLTYTFRIPVLLICTLRGDPQFPDEPQHELMGQITASLLSTLQIPWATFPTQADAIEPTLQQADDYLRRQQRPYVLIMRKGTVAPHALYHQTIGDRPCRAPSIQQLFKPLSTERPSRHQALQHIVEQTSVHDTVIIATTGYTGRELFAIADRPNHLYLVGSMGCASSLGLGLSLARPDLKVVVIDGDGAALMRMGNFATIGSYGGNNLIHLLLDNETHESTGGQATVSPSVSFASIAAACGYASAWEGDTLALLNPVLTTDSPNGAKFGHLKIRTGVLEQLPRPNKLPTEILRRFMHHIGSTMPSLTP